LYKERWLAKNSHWAVGKLLSSDEKKNCCSDVGLDDLFCVVVVRGNKTDNGWSDEDSSSDRSRWNWCLFEDFIFE
jgi:hypothetical protein